MPINCCAAARILIKTLRFSIFVQFLLGCAFGARIPPTVFRGEYFLDAGKKVLRHEPRFPAQDHNYTHFSLISKIMVIAVPGMFIFGCAFPCFWRKKKDSNESAERGLDPMDSTSSFEVKSVHDKVQNSPMRHPPRSPMKHLPRNPKRHVPQSPNRRPPQSPNRRPPQSPNRRPPQSPARFHTSSPRSSENLSKQEPLHLTSNIVLKATHNFSTSSYLGEGGFGSIYKGRLPGGQAITIQRARKEHFHSTEFSNELEILLNIDHRSLLRFLGCVENGSERLIVTEYVSNGTLREHLDGEHGKILDFNQRLEISIDIAHGLTYLHMYADKQIIHRDIKSSNILLTENMKAKVSDFGFARIDSEDTDRTHISTKVKGTLGYLDPEYMRTHKLTPKSDVYSFGILLLEILTGRRPVEPEKPSYEKVLIKWAFNLYKERNVVGLIDPEMKETVSKDILRKMFSVAFQCAAPVRSDRPDMKEVGESLWAIRMDYNQKRRVSS
ncbi:hypothetical protein V2J09_010403 [Rumex salicifolius]